MVKVRSFDSFVLAMFVMSMLAIPVAAASATKVQTEEVSYEVDGVRMTGTLAWDSARKGKRPGVIVVHEWWGHNDYAKRRARMLAELGYTAFALDMYGEGKVTDHPEQAQKFAMEVASNLDGAVKRFNAARAILEQHPTADATKTAAIGYCFGGSVVLHMARIGSDLDGVASFHGGLPPFTQAAPGTIQAKVLVLHGGADAMATAEQVAAFRREMADAKADLTFIEYPGAQHSFTNPDATEVGKKYSLPLAYDADADAKSWTELRTFLSRLFGK